jgi:hypothetical protein
MKNYSIVRIGNEYVVQADEKSILKIASRRRAARLVSDAAGLLDPSDLGQQADAGSSIDHGSGAILIPRSHLIPDAT